MVRASMKQSKYVLFGAGALFLMPGLALGAQRAGVFAPLGEWKSAVMAGDQAALAKLYSVDPPAVTQLGKDKIEPLDEELRYWAGLKSAGLSEFNPKVLEISAQQGQTKLLLRIQTVQADGHKGGLAMVASMMQIWAQQPDGWRIIASRRRDFSPDEVRRLPQPATPNPDLYSDPK